MAGFFDFIKKQPGSASGTPTNAQIPPGTPPGQPVQVAQSQTTVAGQQTQSYNGIGAPPGGGEPYNGIGAPPAAAPMPVETVPAAAQPPVVAMPPSGTPPAPETVAPTPVPPPPGADPNGPVPPPEEKKDEKPAEGEKPADPNAPVDPNAPLDPNGAKKDGDKPADPNAPVDPNAPKDPNAPPADDAAKKPEDQKRMDMDVMTHLTQRSNRVFLSANNKAKELNSPEVDSEHLLHGLLADPEIYKLLTGMKLQPQIIDQELDKIYKKGGMAAPGAAPAAANSAAAGTQSALPNQSPTPGAPQMAPRVKRILDNSLVIARKMGYEFISPEHLMVATYDEGEGVAAQILKKLGLNKEELNKKITGKKEGLNDSATGGPKQQKSAMQQFTIDLTAKAEQGKLDPCVGRSDVIERVIHILSRRLKNNPVLTGEPGVGKTAVVEGLAQAIVAKKVPESLMGKRIMQLDLMSVIAGASHRGEFEERMKNLVDEVKEGKGQIILFIDEIHTIIGAGGGGDGGLDASNFLKPALSRGELQMIGATTITEYKRIEKDAALERRFQSVLVPEPDEETAMKMLKALRDKFEAYHRVKIPDVAIEAAVKLSKRYIGDRFLPDKAVDLIDEAASAVRLPLMSLPEEIKNVEERIAQLKQEKDEADKRGDKVRVRILNSKIDDINGTLDEKKDEYNMKKAQTTTMVTEDIIKDIIAKRTGIPVSKIAGSEMDKIVHLEEIMHQRLIGQERPVKSVAQAVRRGRAGLKNSARPIGSFVFLGPSGVGKTELAKTLAEVLFGQEEAMIRFDMTEYMEKHEVAKLLGPPPGYVGYEEGGKLTEAVRQRQYAVVLFDEVEKAHPDIFNILLQILDDGRLTDNKGRTISFKNTVVICTSNIGTKMIQEDLMKQNKGQVEEPPMLSTYAFSPRGREIMTIATKYFERDGSAKPGTPEPATQNAKKDAPADKNAKDNKDAKKPEDATTDKSKWSEGVLFDYFAGQKLEKQQTPPPAAPNADPNAPQPPAPVAQPVQTQQDESFPVMGYDTHSISSKGVEMISRDSLMYFRNSTTSKVWEFENLIDYFKDNVVINALPDAPDEQLPTARLKTHAFSPDEKEIVTYRDRYWKRAEGSTDWQTGYLKDYFLDQTLKDGNFPATHWDIHTFAPTGKEVIVVGETIWTKEPNVTEWKQQALKEYFGQDFPLEKELDEKNKIESESEAKKYDVIKEKVMNELLKFFRPELVNRFDEVIVFEPLKFIHMIAIVKLQMKALAKTLEEQDMGLSFTDAAVKEIVRSGFDPIFGARPLRRAIQKLIENPISEMIISSKLKPGDFIYLDWDGDNFIFDIQRTEMVAQKGGKADNFTPLDVRAFIEKYFAKDKDAIMKNLIELFPEYKLEPPKTEAKDGDKKEGESKEATAKDSTKDETKKPDDGTSNQKKADEKKPEVAVIDMNKPLSQAPTVPPAPSASTNGMNGNAQAAQTTPSMPPVGTMPPPAAVPSPASPTNNVPVATA